VSSHAHGRNSTDGRVSEPKPHGLGLQISCCFYPKCRRKTLYFELRRYLGEVFHKLAAQKESKIEEGYLMPDHVHMMISIPPKYAVSQVVGFIKGKSAIYLARVYGERKRNFVGQHFWARGFFVNTWAGTRKQSARIAATRRKRIRGWTNSTFGADAATFKWLKTLGPRQRPHLPLRAAPFLKPPALPGDIYHRSGLAGWLQDLPV
jgi:REP element-mobilizing transposase RayT